MSVMISPGMRGAGVGIECAAGAAALAGADGAVTASGGRGRGTAVEAPSATAASFTTGDAFLNIGAGCEPFCMNSTLIRIATVANAPTMNPTASRELQPST